jgi:hypothetical protein
LGQKQTFKRLRLMSALPPKADIGTQSQNIRFVPKADIQAAVGYDCATEGTQLVEYHHETSPSQFPVFSNMRRRGAGRVTRCIGTGLSGATGAGHRRLCRWN